jgi:hypothetical protein
MSPKTRRSGGERRARRERRAKSGELVQTDAMPYDWFGTTGDILGLYLCGHECLQGYFEAFRPVLTGYGIPEALYAGWTGVYFVSTKKTENETAEEQLAGKPWIRRSRQYRRNIRPRACSRGKPAGQRANRTPLGDLAKLSAGLVCPERHYRDGTGQCRPPAFH